jgi:excisionase family DNA binding protein
VYIGLMAKKGQKLRTSRRTEQPEETLVLLKRELRRRGMSDEEIDATIRKKRRRKVLEFNLVKARHLMPHEINSPLPKPSVKQRNRETRPGTSHELCTVEFAADRLKLHRKTVLRFIRDGRLRARRIGKSYRILRNDLEEFAGIPVPAESPASDAWVTSIVDVPGVDPQVAQRWARMIPAALNSRFGHGNTRAEIVYEVERAHLKIIFVGAPAETETLLGTIRVWLEQLKPTS